jgi:hypothetical protein
MFAVAQTNAFTLRAKAPPARRAARTTTVKASMMTDAKAAVKKAQPVVLGAVMALGPVFLVGLHAAAPSSTYRRRPLRTPRRRPCPAPPLLSPDAS